MRSARDKAQESEKAKSDLLTVMSHEMRTPLNGILGSLELIDQDNLDARQKRHLNSISVSGELLLSHVNDVLDLSSLILFLAFFLSELLFNTPEVSAWLAKPCDQRAISSSMPPASSAVA